MKSPRRIFSNAQKAADPIKFDENVTSVLSQLLYLTSLRTERFAGLAWSDRLYGLAQCTPQISAYDCYMCIGGVIAALRNCCSGKTGARVITPSCYVRYDVFPFYNLTDSPTTHSTAESRGKWIQIAGISTVVLVLVVYNYFALIIWRSKKNNSNKDVPLPYFVGEDPSNDGEFQGQGSKEFPSIPFHIINAATNHFCNTNKLGEGGFGPVYKGILGDGKEIAVKRLSKTSGQGQTEFKNEIILIARLQHKNLVRLVGCCLENNEKLLVYEYMQNRSLDVYLFDAKLSVQLDWQRRFNIINGIARGIMYLHEDSRLRIIHRDLKVSNILLDSEMNTKISDFGLARIFGGNQNEASTNRIVGTYGYMAPEYAMEGLFSIKSDVFSFGVLLLEIISGKKNNGFYFYQRGESLLTFAWKLWSEGHGTELIDPVLGQPCVESQVLKCIHIGLLCVQKDPAHRPTMSSVINMLLTENIELPKPTEPAFFVGRVTGQETLHPRDDIVCSVNEVTLSDVEPR